VYVKQPTASVPVPNVRLAAFDRVHVKAGQTVKVHLVIRPDAHTQMDSNEVGASMYTASKDEMIAEGALEVFVGGGQPDHYSGALSQTVHIITSSPLLKCP
jgi:hypothetical protein